VGLALVRCGPVVSWRFEQVWVVAALRVTTAGRYSNIDVMTIDIDTGGISPPQPRVDDTVDIRGFTETTFVKCLGLGISELDPRDIDPRDIKVVSSELGVPSFVLRGSAGKRARSLGISKSHVSVSHESGWAVAIAVACTGWDQEILKCQLKERTDNEHR